LKTCVEALEHLSVDLGCRKRREGRPDVDADQDQVSVARRLSKGDDVEPLIERRPK
jgi:hypothetical protein